MNPRPHSVALVEPTHDVLHRGSCTCGWTVGYDEGSYEWAVERAHEHCADELERELAAGPEGS